MKNKLDNGIKISIITVCYNSAKTIGDTLSSVARQTYENIQHIVVDGGSGDSTLDVVNVEGRHVAIVLSEPDKGIYDAMNKGIGLASGDIIGFINADDFYTSPDVLASVAAVFNDPNVDACYGDLMYVRKNDISSVVRYWKSNIFIPGTFESGWCPPHPTFFVRREIFERFGMFDLTFKIASDFELMMRFLEVHKVRAKYIPGVIVKMRLGGTSNRSLSNIVKQNKEILSALKVHGLRSSILRLISNKLVYKGRQFFVRP